jgi:tetratricopeptide (TPR) repeat protein
MNEGTFFPRALMPIAIGVVIFGGAAILLVPYVVAPHAYPLSPSDHVLMWTWPGPYHDGGQKEASAHTEIERLSAQLGTKDASSYDIDVSIASEYELLGDGKNAYVYLSRAITLTPRRGLAYFNMGHLMETVGALHTAKSAYEAAAKAEADNTLYVNALKEFERQHPSL